MLPLQNLLLRSKAVSLAVTYFIQRGKKKKKSLGILTSSVLVIIQKQSLKLTNDDMHVRSFSAYDLYWQ